MTFTHALATNNYGPAKFIVSSSVSNGTHTTIAAAITAASSGDTIFIRPGTYTENLTLKAGVNICAFEPSAALLAPNTIVPNVIITGKCSFTAAGIVGISGICLKTNSDFALSVTGSAASVVFLDKCFINCSNNTGIEFSSSSASSLISINYSAGDIATTGIALFAHSAAGNIGVGYSEFSNSGLSTTASTCSGTGSFFPTYMYMQSSITFSSSSTCIGNHCNFSMSTNQTVITTSGTNSVTFEHTTIATNGAASAISVGAGTTVALHYVFLSSSNASTIAGTGTLSFTNLTFNSGASLAAGLTLSNASMNSFISGGGVGTSGQVWTSNGASSPPTFQAAGGGVLVQQKRSTTSTAAAVSTTFSLGAVPTTAGGTEFLTTSITPTNSSHILVIEYTYFGSITSTASTEQYLIGALFQDATANAIFAQIDVGCKPQVTATISSSASVTGRFYMTAGTTSSTTFKLRLGITGGSGGFLQSISSTTFAGVQFASLTVTEYTS